MNESVWGTGIMIRTGESEVHKENPLQLLHFFTATSLHTSVWDLNRVFIARSQRQIA